MEPGSRILRWIVDAVLPATCLGCRRSTAVGELHLCPPCRARLKRPARRCVGCARPLIAGGGGPLERCARCRSRRGPLAATLVHWDFEPPLTTVVHAWKYGGRRYLAADLAGVLWDHFAGRLICDRIVPVPMGRLRMLRRGYDQSRDLAEALAGRLEGRVDPLLRRRATPPQSTLSHDRRRANARRSFELRSTERLSGQRCLLVDDVVTTGATLEACATLLRRAGAGAVVAVAVAWTPPPVAPPRPVPARWRRHSRA